MALSITTIFRALNSDNSFSSWRFSRNRSSRKQGARRGRPRACDGEAPNIPLFYSCCTSTKTYRELVIFWVIQSSAQYRIGPEFLCSLTQTPMTRVAVPPSSPAIDPQYPRENPALFTRVLTIYDNRWWRDENERKGGMSTAGSQRITTDDTLRDEVAGDGGRGDGIERVKTGWFTVLVVVPAVNELIEKMREGWAEKWNTLSLETEYVEVQCSNLSTIAVFAGLRVGGQDIAFPPRFFVGGNRVFSLNFGVLEGLELHGPCGIVEEGKKEAHRGSEKEASRISGIIRSALKRPNLP
ncbi:hypothetical protein B0H14DRAFT_2583697 [Mycena olivaceomarginata]|nr:hypothetical protein B0H14DRAFT_2583697 [Mycena olivaceomarginata]